MGNTVRMLDENYFEVDSDNIGTRIFCCKLCGKVGNGMWMKYWYEEWKCRKHLKEFHQIEKVEIPSNWSRYEEQDREKILQDPEVDELLKKVKVLDLQDRIRIVKDVAKMLRVQEHLENNKPQHKFRKISAEAESQTVSSMFCDDKNEENKMKKQKELVEGGEKNLFHQKVRLLRNSLIILSNSQDAIYNRMSSENMSYSNNFPQKMTDPNHYPLYEKFKSVETEVLKELSITFDGADNNDVWYKFSKDSTKNYIPMTMHITFILDTDKLGSVNLSNLMKGIWKKDFKKDKEWNGKVIRKLMTFDVEEKDRIRGELFQLVNQISKKTIGSYQPFGSVSTKVDANYTFYEDINWENPKSVFRAYKKFLYQQGYVVLPLTKEPCKSEDDFVRAYKFIEGFKSSSFSFKIGDQPGHKAARKRWPSIIVALHVWKYALLSSFSGNWDFGLSGFFKSNPFGNEEKKKQKNFSSIPHGFLKKCQGGWYNWTVTILHKLISIICAKEKWNIYSLESHQIDFVCKSIQNPKDYIFGWKIFYDKSGVKTEFDWNNQTEVKGSNLSQMIKDGIVFLDLADHFCETLLPPLLLKRGQKIADVQLYLLGLKLILPLLIRGNHPLYFSSVFEMLMDYHFIWSEEVQLVFEKFFVFQTVYGSFVSYDEKYEKVNKEEKTGGTTSPDKHAIRNSLTYNLVKFFKIIDSRNVLFTKKYLQDFEWLEKSTNNFDHHIKPVIANLRYRIFQNNDKLPKYVGFGRNVKLVKKVRKLVIACCSNV